MLFTHTPVKWKHNPSALSTGEGKVHRVNYEKHAAGLPGWGGGHSRVSPHTGHVSSWSCQLLHFLCLCLGVWWPRPCWRCPPSLWAPTSGAGWIRTHPDLPKLPVPKTLDQLQRLPWDLPHVFGFDRQVGEAGHPFVAGNHQAAAETRGPVCGRTDGSVEKQMCRVSTEARLKAAWRAEKAPMLLPLPG